MDSCSKHFETGMSGHGFSLCGSLYRWLPVDEKCVFFSDAVLSLHAYLFLSPSLLSRHTDPPMDPVLLGHLLLRDCWEFLLIYLFLIAHSQILFFRILPGVSELSFTLEVLCSPVTSHTPQWAVQCVLVYVMIWVMFSAQWWRAGSSVCFCLLLHPQCLTCTGSLINANVWMMGQAHKPLLSTYCVPGTAQWREYTSKICLVFRELQLPWETVMLGDKLSHRVIRTATKI